MAFALLGLTDLPTLTMIIGVVVVGVVAYENWAATSQDAPIRRSRGRLVPETPSLARIVTVDASAMCEHTHLLGHGDDFD